MTVCPKCSYARTAAETAPAWQCPACGIAYAKFGAGARPPAGERPEEGDLRVRASPSGGGDRAGSSAITLYAAVLFTFYVLIFVMPNELTIVWLPAPIAACAFVFWLVAYRRLKVVEDTPTSAIAAAAQGYVELRGTVVPAPGNSLAGFLTRMPCVWYRCDYRRGKEQHTEERSAVFILRDDTGDCVIDPAAAEVICDRRQTVPGGFEWSIRTGDTVHAIGHFSSGGVAAERHVGIKAAIALAGQQRDAAAFAERYDADGDGKVDSRETAAAREALRREILREYAAQGGAHALGPSPDGRPFLVVRADHDRVASRYRRLTLFHLAVFLGALGAWAWVWRL